MDFAQARVVEQGNQLHVVHGDDAKLYVEFTLEAVHQPALSEQEGRPIYKDVPHIRIHFPGDRTKQIFRPVKMEADYAGPADPVRFSRQWTAFMAQQEQVQTGTPLLEWGPLTKSQAMELKGLHIHTVEQLAGIADSNLTWLGARELRDKAVAWLKQADGGKEAVRLQGELEKRDLDIANLREQMREMAERMDATTQADGGKKAAAPKKIAGE
ncbi:chromosome partitioning protein ParA [Paraburkholderia fynbosensis]|uniref:Uncharacterized protein n=1 Tax=Paraburkholderia fynbosensis TaxID=1200993 RepID=A0A6J5FK10_9BURK|nr:chromosome partitioning protein ParA [Paraburkholderia fynbosensis]CAB3782069.1 hypothetical protein LMG27177_01158 [Paraburkholderia fynbosensis]